MNVIEIDRVYGFDSTTKQLYDDGVKAIALSVLNGINCKHLSHVITFYIIIFLYDQSTIMS